MNMKKTWLKKLLIVLLIVLLAVAGVVYYIFTDKFANTVDTKATYTVNALDLIQEYQKTDTSDNNYLAQNKKYAEQIIVVNGRVSSVEFADTTVNVKIADSLTNAYIIFAFQQQDAAKAKQVKAGDSISIKGSCSGGAYSEVFETVFINFKRAAILH
jgi:flagellar basal body-associated protein FliL